MDDFPRFYQEGGFFMHPIALCALLGAGILLERFIVLLFRYDLDGRRFFNQIQKLVITDDIDRAIKLCLAAEGAALARVMRAGLRCADSGRADIGSSMHEATLAVTPKIRDRIPTIAAIANIALLLGLTGTVFGMIEGFSCTMVVSAELRSQALARSISLAINTTGFGLIVAIPMLAARLFVQNLARKISDEVELYAVKLENLLAARVHNS